MTTDNKFEIEGSFGNKKIPVHIFKASNSSNILINIHGTYGDMYSGSQKYLRFAKAISESSVANVILYQSSRYSSSNKKLSYEEKQSLFKGKTFQDEMDDLLYVIKHITTNKNSLFDNDVTGLHLNGNSLGGILAFLASTYYNVSSINTVGTGVRLVPKDIPILSTYPDLELIKSVLSKFSGRFLMNYGTHDNVFDQGSFDYLYSHVTNAEKRFIKYVGVDHTFKLLYNEFSLAPYNNITENCKKLINGEKLNSTAVYLESDEFKDLMDEGGKNIKKNINNAINDHSLDSNFKTTIEDSLSLNVD